MAVDEFGREIPVPTSRPARPTSPLYGGAGGAPLPPIHHHQQQQQQQQQPNYHQVGSFNTPYPPALPLHHRENRGGGTGAMYGRMPPRGGRHYQDTPLPRFQRPPLSQTYHQHLHTQPQSEDGRVMASELEQQQQQQQHISQVYQEEPLLCEFVWKDKAKNDKGDEVTTVAAAEDSPTTEPVSANENAEKDRDHTENADGNGKINDHKNRTGVNPYDEYRKSYCLRYIRAFFNHHLDDSWFRERYSPLVRRRVALQERQRAAAEARVVASQLRNHTAEFVAEASLSGGMKERENVVVNKIPTSHVLSMVDRALHIQDIPSFVTNEQMEMALLEHCSASAASAAAAAANNGDAQPHRPMEVYAIAPQQRDRLLRDAIVICASTQMVDDIVAHFTEEQDRRRRGAAAAAAAAGSALVVTAVPRKEGGGSSGVMAGSSSSTHSKAPETVWLEFDVDARDPYGRVEQDADGKGGSPADGSTFPARKATLRLAKYNRPQPIVVLSAALSSPTRFAQDKTAAILLARALDMRKNIPNECRLDELLEHLSKDDDGADERLLDVAIAYLRRVHLFSFYNGCSLADSLAEVLLKKHPAGTIHLRLANAGTILHEAAKARSETNKGDGENNNENQKAQVPEEPVKDLLVQRLDDSISKALENCETWIQLGQWAVDEETDRDAEAIEQEEENATDRWLADHSMLDEDRRARCSFHFCHKLFKDEVFLRKHLLKKHGEYLKAEQAKCHDEYMMKAWDAEENRPVPEIMVDCGIKFGLRSASVTGREPDCVDPEPELWRKEEEKRQREAEQRQRREEHRQARKDEERIRTFVDVDDMKEEKVELSFDNVQVPPPVNKKKKKRKLL